MQRSMQGYGAVRQKVVHLNGFSIIAVVRQKQRASAGGTSTSPRFLGGHRRSRLYRNRNLELKISLVKYSHL